MYGRWTSGSDEGSSSRRVYLPRPRPRGDEGGSNGRSYRASLLLQIGRRYRVTSSTAVILVLCTLVLMAVSGRDTGSTDSGGSTAHNTPGEGTRILGRRVSYRPLRSSSSTLRSTPSAASRTSPHTSPRQLFTAWPPSMVRAPDTSLAIPSVPSTPLVHEDHTLSTTLRSVEHSLKPGNQQVYVNIIVSNINR